MTSLGFSMKDLWEGKHDAGEKKLVSNFGVLDLHLGRGGEGQGWWW